MDAISLTTIATTTRGTSESLVSAARDLWKGLVQAPTLPRAQVQSALNLFWSKCVRVLLDWMGAGREEAVRGLLAQIRGRLNEMVADPRAPAGIDKLAPPDQVVARLQVLAEVADQYARSGNLARLLGQLTGRRRAEWRRALSYIYELKRPVTVQDVLVPELGFGGHSTADYALNKLAALGILERHDDGPAKYFTITWSGRDVCAALDGRRPADEDGEAADDEQGDDDAALAYDRPPGSEVSLAWRTPDDFPLKPDGLLEVWQESQRRQAPDRRRRSA